MSFVKLDQKSNKLQVDGLSVTNAVVFNYFDSLPFSEREEAFLRALYIGVLAMKEDRLSSFLSKTTNELGTQLESLKLIFDLKQELFFKSTAKGFVAEAEVLDFLTDFLQSRKLSDQVALTGTSTGAMKRNKTGDIVCLIDGTGERKIVVECKFDKSLRMGSIDKKDVFLRKSDTVWSQLIEAQANRGAAVGIIVFDRELIDSNVLAEIENVRHIPAIGFVVVVDSRKGDFSNLGIAYLLARDLALSEKRSQIDFDLFNVFVRRIVRDVSDVLEIRALVSENIANNRKILEKVQRNLMSLEFSRDFLTKYLAEGSLTKEDLLNFYNGGEISEQFKAIAIEIEAL